MGTRLAWVALALAACGGGSPASDAGASPTDPHVTPPIDGNGIDVGNPPPPDAFVPPHDDAGTAPQSVAQRAHDIAMTLRGSPHFLVGMGSDLDGPPNYD